MKFRLWPQLRDHIIPGAGPAFPRFLNRLVALLKMPAPDAPQLIQRIQIMERDIILPLKAAGIAMLFYSFYFTPWIGLELSAWEIAVGSTQYFFWLYVGVNLLVAGMLLAMQRLPLALIEWAVFTISLVDGIFLSALTLVSGGYDSILYWLFLGLIVRSAISVPRATSQLMLNLTISACYVLAGVIEIGALKTLDQKDVAELLDPTERPLMELSMNPTEHLVLRLALLLTMTLCCYAVQVLLERHRQSVEQAREFDLRESQLRSAGRLAAEFAHQIKNPLAIINNAAFSLQRAVKEGKAIAAEQIRIIQEEVERSDRIITQIMGYAQLSEGRVEKLSVTEELERAINHVFPPAVRYPIQIHRDYAASFPPLLMQRRHFFDTVLNVLQNARDALEGKGGNLFVNAHCTAAYAIEISIRDDGPGIPADKQGNIFEAYYTTKEKGTGLGLATVKHNVELYGGEVRVESELGKGTRFVLLFPARTLIRLAKPT